MQGTQGQEEDFKKFPHMKQQYIKVFDMMLEHMWAEGSKTTWKTGEDVFEWWLYSTDKEQEQVLEGQIEFEDLE